jgi:hypothetical protein
MAFHRPIYFFIFLTGTAGLIYQVAWHKYLSRMLGSDSIATAVILAAFLGGLSAGYYLCGKFTTRANSHFRVYAMLEEFVCFWGLGFPLIFRIVDNLTRQRSFAPPLAIIAQGLFCFSCSWASQPWPYKGGDGNVLLAEENAELPDMINTFLASRQ